MKNLLFLFLSIAFIGCNSINSEEKQLISADKQRAIDLALYHKVWSSYLAGDTSVMSEKYFTK